MRNCACATPQLISKPQTQEGDKHTSKHTSCMKEGHKHSVSE